MNAGMQWKGGRHFGFSVKVEQEALELVFEGSSADRFNAQSLKTGKSMILIKLKGEEVADVFGKVGML